jgi:hypothetical protein
MRPISCVAARAHGIAHIYYVAGERRFVAMTSATDQEPIATAKCGQGGGNRRLLGVCDRWASRRLPFTSAATLRVVPAVRCLTIATRLVSISAARFVASVKR